LVDIQVQDRDTTDAILGLHQASGNRHIIEATKTLTPISMGVMGAPSQIDTDPIQECCAGCSNRGASGAPRTFHHFGRPGKPNRSLVGLIQTAVAKAANPVRVMRKGQLTIGRSRRLKQLYLRQALFDRRTK
jgi:hypothetical protein